MREEKENPITLSQVRDWLDEGTINGEDEVREHYESVLADFDNGFVEWLRGEVVP